MWLHFSFSFLPLPPSLFSFLFKYCYKGLRKSADPLLLRMSEPRPRERKGSRVP